VIARLRHRANRSTTEPASAGVDTNPGEVDPALPQAPSSSDVSDQVRRRRTSRVIVFGLIPVIAMGLAVAAGYLKWQQGALDDSGRASVESVRAATDAAVKMLSYRPDTADAALRGARDDLTGHFRDAYAALVNDVVVPGAKQKSISAVATVPAASSVASSPTHAVVLLFIDQSIVVGSDAPTASSSVVKVTLEKISGRWLVSAFDPV